jgi:Cu/Ag efflux pump CusA
LRGDRNTMEDILRMTVWTPKGAVALKDIAAVERGEGPNVIEREDRERQIVIWAFPQNRPLGDVSGEITR